MTHGTDSDADEPLLQGHAHPPSPSHNSSRLLVSALLTVFLLIGLAFLTTPLLLHSLPRFLRPGPPSAKPGCTIVAACSNRHPMLQEALQSWLKVNHADQLLLVDWSSSPPLLPTVKSVLQKQPPSMPVRVVRVDNESDWVLSRAYNLAIHHAAHEIVFKVDCDYILSPSAAEAHALTQPDDTFYAGYYRNARSANEIHLNGALVVSQAAFWRVGGYDERIQTYGYDDEDLYDRLVAAGSRRLNVSYDQVSHLDHEDSHRGQEGIRFPRVQIDMNRLLLESISKPWSRSSRASEYVVVDGDRNRLEALYVPTALASLVSGEEWTKIRKLALGRRLHDDYVVPWGVITSMNIPTAEKLLANFKERRASSDFDEVLDKDETPRFLMIHVQNGLGNRLRVLGSGLSFARRTNREPIVIWEADVHFGALFADLFDDTEVRFAVLDTFGPKWPLADHAEYDKAWEKIVYYNYMLPEGVGEFIEDDDTKSIYFKSSAIMNSNLTTWESENFQILELVVTDEIEEMAAKVYNKGMDGVGGVQIRNRSLDEDIIGVKDNRGLYSKDDAAILDKWRATTKMDNFVSEVRGLLKNGTVEKFFVASDTIGVCKKLQQMFPDGKIMYIPRNCDDRGARCEKFALADLLVLAQTEVLLGSTWSSFTEAAMRLGGPKALLAGTDFGVGPKEGR